MALGDPYAALALLKTRLGITDTNDDASLTSALDAASQTISGYCGRQFNAAGSATARVYYPDSPYTCTVDDISTITGLLVKGDYGNDGTFEITWAATDYSLEPLNGIMGGDAGWPYWRIRAVGSYLFPIWYVPVNAYPRPSVQITANWGWATVPGAVAQACLVLAEEIFKLKDAPFGVANFSEFGAIRVRDNPKVASLLQRYMRDPILIA